MWVAIQCRAPLHSRRNAARFSIPYECLIRGIGRPRTAFWGRGRGMPGESRSAGPVRFGVFELDRRSGELRKAGVRISLQEQALQVLTLLLERPGDLVTRDELRQRLWPTG